MSAPKKRTTLSSDRSSRWSASHNAFDYSLQTNSNVSHNTQNSRGTRRKGGSIRDEAQRRAQDIKGELETAIHVLDNGVNRTPLPLQRQLRGLMGLHGSRFHRESSMVSRSSIRGEANYGNELGSSIFPSSFIFGITTENMLSSRESMSVSYMHSFANKSAENNNSMGDMLSMKSLSTITSGTTDSSGAAHYRGRMQNASSAIEHYTSDNVSRFQQKPPVFNDIVFAAHEIKPLSDSQRRAWVQATTTLTLSETPVVFLYSHADEAVSNENADEMQKVQQRNETLKELQEAYRLNDGTRFQNKGTITFTNPQKSIHCDVKPPEKTDAGALQVTPWMLKDAFAPLGDDLDDGGEREGKGLGKEGDNNHSGDDNEDADLIGDPIDESIADNSDIMSGSVQPSSDLTTERIASATTGNPTDRTSAFLDQWMWAESLLSNLRIMERVVVQNIMERVQMAYRGIQMTPAEGARLPHIASCEVPHVLEEGWNSSQLTSTVAQRQVCMDASSLSNGTDPLVNVELSTALGGGGEKISGDVGRTDVNEPAPNQTGAEEKPQDGRPELDLPPMNLSDHVRALWRYHSPLTQNRSVTCMAWNRKQPDILAVGYSVARAMVVDTAASTTADEDKNLADCAAPRNTAKNSRIAETEGTKCQRNRGGLVCCWSLKNPLAPELALFLNADIGVTSLAFALKHPSLLAVGDTEGGIVVYDIHKDLVTPSIVPAVSAGLHTGAVWELKWVPGGKERDEFLMSTSADGRVVQWVVGKAVERIAPDLTHLKRRAVTLSESAFVKGVLAADEAAGRRQCRKAREEAVLSRQAAGMCFDVCPFDHAVYIVGTDDGSIYQCNKSQTESYDLEYVPHTELVYRISWSPFSSKHFLTCSADWTTRLYQLGQAAPILSFDSTHQDAVQDVAWSYSNALVFATVSAQGNLEVWSVADNIYPRVTVSYKDRRWLHTVLFAEQETPVVVVGDDQGDVTVFLLEDKAYGRQKMTDEEQERWLEETISKTSFLNA